MAVKAAVDGDVTLLKQAMLHDPLTAAVCDPDEIWQMTDDMLVARAKWRPQYKSETPAAKKRLASQKALGVKKWQGAARLHTRTVEEMRKNAAQARQQAAAADKAAAKRSEDVKRVRRKGRSWSIYRGGEKNRKGVAVSRKTEFPRKAGRGTRYRKGVAHHRALSRWGYGFALGTAGRSRPPATPAPRLSAAQFHCAAERRGAGVGK